MTDGLPRQISEQTHCHRIDSDLGRAKSFASFRLLTTPISASSKTVLEDTASSGGPTCEVLLPSRPEILQSDTRRRKVLILRRGEPVDCVRAVTFLEIITRLFEIDVQVRVVFFGDPGSRNVVLGSEIFGRRTWGGDIWALRWWEGWNHRQSLILNLLRGAGDDGTSTT